MEIKNYFITTLAISLFLLISYSFAENYSEKLRLIVSLEKAEFEFGESIYGLIRVINISDSAVKIPPHFDLSAQSYLELFCTNSDGKVYSGYPLNALIIGGKGVPISPEDSLVNSFNVLNCFGEETKENYLSYYYLPKGEYVLQAKFRANPIFDKANQNPDSLFIFSNKFKFRISTSEINLTKEPAYQLLLYEKQKYNKKRKSYGTQYRQNVKKIMEKYPESIYRDFTDVYLISHFFKDKDYLKSMIDMYHNKFLFFNSIDRLIVAYYEHQDYELYDYLVKNYPNSFGKKVVDYKLRTGRK